MDRRESLSGHFGERTGRRVALVTDDLRIYHDLVPVFAERGVTLLGLRPDEPVPDTVQVLLGGPPSDHRSVPLHDDGDANVLAVAQALDDRPTAREAYREVVVGIDPGATIGLAVVCDGAAFLTAHASTPTDAVHRATAWLAGLRGGTVRIHVGDGAPAVRDAVVDAFTEGLPSATVHLVPEARTTPTSPWTQSRHTDAAIHIALRRP